MHLENWKQIFDYAEKYGFIIAADECYSEIYFEEINPPLGALQAAHQLGRDHHNLIVFSSLSKRSNVPGMRSGFVAGDPAIIEKFLLYRTYHGCAMNPAVQAASIAAWNDEQHVLENRRLYASKFEIVTPMLEDVLQVKNPTPHFTFGPKHRLQIPNSPFAYIAILMSLFYPAAISQEKPTASTPAKTSSASHWSPHSKNVRKPQNASRNYADSCD